ncbi:uncharacterized protein LOC112546746 isoform X7 [Pelodiscus sinensis]|uniref:uncharacterized protein LOC112546746 isoform X7 n=1 Tax=Pelodiscus sinensis TaxID=13735 RepID=UPI003F6AB98A
MLRDTPSSLPSEFSRLAEDGSPCGPAGPFHFGPFRGLARKGVHSLYQVILHHRGLNIHQAEDLWCRHWYKERWVLAHSNTVRVGEFSPLPLVLANCLSAACSLRTLKPPLQAQLLSPLLRAAVRQTVSGDWQQEPIHKLVRPLPHAPLLPSRSRSSLWWPGSANPDPLSDPGLRLALQELSWAFLDILHALLANLLIQSPDTARLQLIMEHLSTWLDSPPAPGVSQGPWQHHGPAASRHHPPGV